MPSMIAELKRRLRAKDAEIADLKREMAAMREEAREQKAKRKGLHAMWFSGEEDGSSDLEDQQKEDNQAKATKLYNRVWEKERERDRLKNERDNFEKMITGLKLKADATNGLVQDHLEETDWRDDTDSLRELRRMNLSAKDKAEMIEEGVIHE